jgi:hypothetical protein
MTDKRKRRKTKDDVLHLQFLWEDDSTDETLATENEVGTINLQPVVDVGTFTDAQIQNEQSYEVIIHYSFRTQQRLKQGLLYILQKIEYEMKPVLSISGLF